MGLFPVLKPRIFVRDPATLHIIKSCTDVPTPRGSSDRPIDVQYCCCRSEYWSDSSYTAPQDFHRRAYRRSPEEQYSSVVDPFSTSSKICIICSSWSSTYTLNPSIRIIRCLASFKGRGTLPGALTSTNPMRPPGRSTMRSGIPSNPGLMNFDAISPASFMAFISFAR